MGKFCFMAFLGCGKLSTDGEKVTPRPTPKGFPCCRSCFWEFKLAVCLLQNSQHGKSVKYELVKTVSEDLLLDNFIVLLTTRDLFL